MPDAPVPVQLDDMRVMFARARKDETGAIQQDFERAVGLKARKSYGVFYPETHEYRVCAQLDPDDDPQSRGFEVATLPGGAYLRARLRGEPPAIYEKIGPTFDQLVKKATVDGSRPSIEFYRSRDVIDLMVPVT